ncbi:MAG: endonuclease NucS [Candidatus Electryonea clarkiae]|nr:endonuclease NucS [Candidatus Electryonea clarkiae]MDP8288794.1 endonuclease NucS [Candidatus Electryonea clarkiae]
MSVLIEEQKDQIITFLNEGKNSEEISELANVSPRTVRAIKAHLTRGTYAEISETIDAIDAYETTFRLERDLQTALRSNIGHLEQGLKIIDDGKERKINAGRIDITAEDKEGAIVVIELKAGTASPDAIAQILAYMGSLGETEEKPLRGILVAGDFHPRIIFAARAIPNLSLMKYSFKLSFEHIQ